MVSTAGPSWAQGIVGTSARGISDAVFQKISLTEALARARRTPAGIFPSQVVPLARSVFRARPKSQPHGHAYSGTVFKINWKGQEEIYGVIAAHTISPSSAEIALERSFVAEVFQDGQFTAIPAQIVQASASKLLDVALVKFRPEDEKLFFPLELAEQEPAKGAVLQGLGFSNNQLVWLPERTLLGSTDIALRTDMFVLRPGRYGLCGSPMIDEKGKIVAIHTGSSYEMDPADDMGFGTKAQYVRMLVKAYHQGNGKATFPLFLENRQIARLNVDEFVSQVRLWDDEGNMIWRWETQGKFPYNFIKQIISNARYAELSINRVGWNGNFLMQDPLIGPRFVKYDLKKGKVAAQGKGTLEEPKVNK